MVWTVWMTRVTVYSCVLLFFSIERQLSVIVVCPVRTIDENKKKTYQNRFLTNEAKRNHPNDCVMRKKGRFDRKRNLPCK